MAHVPTSGVTSSVETEIVAVPAAVEVGRPTSPKSASRKRGKIPRLLRWQVCLVEWLDAVSFDGGMNSDTSHFELPVRKSVGHFIRRSKEGLVLAMEDDRGVSGDASDCDSVTAIPLGLIRKVTVYVPRD